MSLTGDELFAAGRFDEAIAAYRRVLTANAADAQARMGLDAILERARTTQPNAQLRELLLQAYADKGANWDAVGWGAANQLLVGWPADENFEVLAQDRLLHAFLRKSLNRDAALERKLLKLRAAVAARPPSPAIDELVASLAEQAWFNEYIWPDDPAVTDRAKTAMFRPPAMPRAEQAEERALAAAIPEIAPVTDTVSQSVAAMYEANPYPRWMHLARRPKVDVRAALMRDFSHADAVDFGDRPLQVLMPGAGTGQHPLTVASSYRNVEVTALDLSRASLAYGKRMAARYDVSNIEFLRGDILDLAKLGRIFGHAECVGVLHHMADPKAGLLAISSVLRPGAFLRLGLYGEHARAIVVKARRDIERARLPATLDGLREFRRKVMTGEWRRLRALTGWEDFWSASLLRDLCFHVQEHRFTVARLGRSSRAAGCAFSASSSMSAALSAPTRRRVRSRSTPRASATSAPWRTWKTGSSSNARSRTCFLAMPSSAKRSKGG